MIQETIELNKIYNSIEYELSSYALKHNIELINNCYFHLEKAVKEIEQLPEPFAHISLSTALDLAKLGIHPKIIASTLIYYLLSSEILSIDDIKRIDEYVAEFSSTSLVVNKPFEQFLPWNKATNKSKLVKRSNSAKSKIKIHQEKEKQEDIKVQYIMTVSKLPEIAIANVIQRMHVVRWLPKITQESGLQRITASETLSVYAVVAEMLGIWNIKWRIEDAAFKLIKPEIYNEIVFDLNERRVERDAVIDHAVKVLKDTLNAEGLPAKVVGRAKHIYGLYLKTRQNNLSVKEVNDSLGLRILVDNDMGETGCYLALDILLRLWEPVKGIYGDSYCRDWISNPKPNGYKSIHTTVQFIEKQIKRMLEVQIRTEEMNEIAEYGIASHWIYKRAGNSLKSQNRYENYIEKTSAFRKAYEDH